MNDIKYPHMRGELIDDLRALFEPARATDKFALRSTALDYLVHFLYDDTSLGSDADAAIGWFLRSRAEAEAITVLVKSFDRFFSLYGLKPDSEGYFERPEWLEVERNGLLALSLLRDGAPKGNGS
ncbi:hypothetical protein [Lysobacter sp. Root604]|uniref:SCO4402 family protein n=1 Tax=Lysobacter sp. Root604 TaxID=1736568 RepID=UPI0006F39521|nr:hypothetical protein [Lysobacter sp. Root604]KRA20368.1 hypothetical protein ASD69_03220 [Lysobacter sp. Root604]